MLAMRKVLLNANIIDECNISFEGREFDSSGKSLWLREQLVNLDGSEFTNCKSQSTYLYVLTIFAKKNSGSENINDMLSELNDIYIAGNTSTYANIVATIFKCEDSAYIYDENWMNLNFTVTFQSLEQ